MKEAYYYIKLDHQRVKCTLCPHECIINEGKRGICLVRKNISGILYAETWEQASVLNVDPVEKKPLYAFYPRKPVLSLGSLGCNMLCRFCQNSDISRCLPQNYSLTSFPVKDVIEKAINIPDNIGIAYTYNEPIVWYEYMLETAREAKKKQLKNIVVSNGYFSREPLQELLPYIDAFNVDLKAFNNKFYKGLTGSKLEPVLETIKEIVAYGLHPEITNLIIPGYNDDEEEFENMIRWIKDHAGEDTVLHISRFFPAYKMLDTPLTPVDTIKRLQEIARRHLNHVFPGNV